MPTPAEPLDEFVKNYVKNNLGEFHKKRIDSLSEIQLKKILRRKNPYLFRAKSYSKGQDIVDGILTAHLSSSEEGIFGNWLERLAIAVNGRVYGGKKSASDGVDLEFEREGKRYFVAIKSGPNWNNSSSLAKLTDHFNSAKKKLKTSGGSGNGEFVIGCCYGQSNPQSEFKAAGYYIIRGQRFWELISGNKDLYTDLNGYIGEFSGLYNQEFQEKYAQVVNKLTEEFLAEYSDNKGDIDWVKLVVLTSGPPIVKKKWRQKSNGDN
jgi:Type II restriction endonuclease EcoO109I